MFAIIYSFKVRADREQHFLNSWGEMTQLIYQFDGSLGSRLHRKADLEYIAYAQWPSKKHWQNSGDNLPDEADMIRKTLRDSCHEIATLYELEMVEDQLKLGSEPNL